MPYPKHEILCDKCEGHKRVAIIRSGPRMFEHLVGKPIPMIFWKAKQRLQSYSGDAAGFLTELVRGLAEKLDTTLCPWCEGSGVRCTIQQIDPEEDAGAMTGD